MSALKPRIPTTPDHEYSNIFEAQTKDIKTAFMNMVEVYKEETNNFL